MFSQNYRTTKRERKKKEFSKMAVTILVWTHGLHYEVV